MATAGSLVFKNGNPGIVQYGNFINYYQFHSVVDRIKLLPSIQTLCQRDICHALDLGCNSGDLTIALHDLLQNSQNEKCYTLGVDIDPILIERAKEKTNNESIQFMSLDLMSDEQRKEISEYMESRIEQKFDVVFCFSLTMWIHLNHGDDGLKIFLSEICRLGRLIVIEPQPWSCYKKAVKRMKLANSEFPLYKKLRLQNNIETEIEALLTEQCKCVKVFESDRNDWGRKILIFQTSC